MVNSPQYWLNHLLDSVDIDPIISELTRFVQYVRMNLKSIGKKKENFLPFLHLIFLMHLRTGITNFFAPEYRERYIIKMSLKVFYCVIIFFNRKIRDGKFSEKENR